MLDFCAPGRKKWLPRSKKQYFGDFGAENNKNVDCRDCNELFCDNSIISIVFFLALEFNGLVCTSGVDASSRESRSASYA